MSVTQEILYIILHRLQKKYRQLFPCSETLRSITHRYLIGFDIYELRMGCNVYNLSRGYSIFGHIMTLTSGSKVEGNVTS